MVAKSWLVVGATRGIGLALVKQLIAKDPAYIVFATARKNAHAEELQEFAKGSNGRVTVFDADVTDEASLDQLVEQIKQKTSSLDHVIVNAGVALGFGGIDSATAKEFQDNFNVNIIGSQNVIKAIHPLVVASTAAVKNISVMGSAGASVGMFDVIGPMVAQATKQDSFPLGPYAVSKTALTMLAKLWGQKLESSGVAVAVVHPGSVDTDNAKHFDKAMLISATESADGLIKAILEADIAKSKTGVLGFDGNALPW